MNFCSNLANGCHIPCRNNAKPTVIKVNYNNGRIIVQKGDEHQNFYPCIDLSIKPLPFGYYFGFTATTGDLAGSNYFLFRIINFFSFFQF